MLATDNRIIDHTPDHLRREVDTIAATKHLTPEQRDEMYSRAVEAYRNVRDRRLPRYVEIDHMRY